MGLQGGGSGGGITIPDFRPRLCAGSSHAPYHHSAVPPLTPTKSYIPDKHNEPANGWSLKVALDIRPSVFDGRPTPYTTHTYVPTPQSLLSGLDGYLCGTGTQQRCTASSHELL